MHNKIFKLSAMVLVISLMTGCLTACPTRIYSEDRKSIEGLEIEIEDLEDEIESLNSQLESMATTESAQTTPIESAKYDLTIWSFTTETETMATAFMETHPDVSVNVVFIPLDNNTYRDEAIAAAYSDDCPDVLVLDSRFTKEFVDSDMLLDISDLKTYADELFTYSNTLAIGTNFETGEIRAYSYQNSVGTVFYRRSLAIKYFGTDDPSEIQAKMSDMQNFSDMAKTVSEKSGGKTFMISSMEELIRPVLNNREQPWYVDNTLVVDPVVDGFFDIAKVFHDNGYEAGATQWTEGWYSGMNDTLTNTSGEPVQIFCYFLPTWGLPYVLGTNCPDTEGDWACCAGPLPYQWGGSWLSVMKNAKNQSLAKEFVRFCALDEETLTKWATGVYSNEYLTGVSQGSFEVERSLSQPAGDFVSSQLVVESVISQFDNSSLSVFLGGQNFYAAFAEAAQRSSAALVQKDDEMLMRILFTAIDSYASGKMTKAEAIEQFKKEAK